MIKLTEHPDGIYFDLADQEYHHDPALGSTDIRSLTVAPSTYWWRSKYNPLYRDKESPARLWGKLFHCLVLEGEAAFKSRYMRGPCRDDFPDAMETATDLKEWLKRRKYATSGTKAELVARVQGIDPGAQIWDVIKDRFGEEAAGRTIVDYDTYDEVVLSSQLITKNPDLQKSFVGGYPEVSVFWTTNGVRFKCRFDYLKKKTVIDLKSFTNMRDKPLIKAIAHDNVAGHRYDIQGAHYLTGRYELRRLIAEDRVFGDVDRDWLAGVAKVEDPQFAWVFTEVPHGAVSVGVVFPIGSHTHSLALRDIDAAVEAFRKCRETFGMSSLWVHPQPTIRLSDEDMPVWLGQG